MDNIDKKCSQCGGVKIGNYKTICRKCYASIRHKANYVVNATLIKAKVKKWNDANKEHRARRDREYAQRNRDNKLAYYKDYYQKNKSKRIAQSCISFKNRRAHKKATAGGWTLTAAWWGELIMKYNDRCAFCGRYGVDDTYGHLTVEHLVPLSRGGAHAPDNIVPACQPCNDSKQSKTCEEWGTHPQVWS